MKLIVLLFFIGLSIVSDGQKATKSVFINFGRESCSASYWGSDFTLISDAQTVLPDTLLNCDVSSTIGNVFSKFISYNAFNNRVYINDISDFVNSKIYILDIGLPASLTCPTISTYNYMISNVILNQFEFDQLGDLYALSNYNASLGTANIGAYDDTTGLLKPGSLKTLYFPAGHFPADVSNGDIAIVPNGRMFCVFGGDTSKFFEIFNYRKTNVGNATTTYLGTPANVCYGLAYDNGYMIMAGTNLGGYCYAYSYNLTTQVLGSETAAPINCMPIDDASFSPSIGIAEDLFNAINIDATHWDLTYRIYLKNLGNVKVGNVQVKNDLAGTFGAGKISNISTTWISNNANLVLNNTYNGNSNVNLLNTGQNMPNTPANKTIGIIELKVRITNPINLHTYNNSSIMNGKVGGGVTLLQLADSSNDYDSTFHQWSLVVDPSINNVADDRREGIPTPWAVGMVVVPIQLSSFDVKLENNEGVLSWTTYSENNNHYFAIERSGDCLRFDSIGMMSGIGNSTIPHSYSFNDNNLTGSTLYYRLRQVNFDGTSVYSVVKMLMTEAQVVSYSVYPNPASEYLVLESSMTTEANVNIEIFNLYGTKVFEITVPGSSLRQKIILPASLSNGYYMMMIKNGEQVNSFFNFAINKSY